MRALALVVLLASGAYAANDAPVMAPEVRLPLPLPPRGSPEERVAIAKLIASCYAENTDMKDELKKQMHPLVFVAIVASAVLVGGAVGFGVAKATDPKK